MLEGQHYQNGYVTRNIDKALQRFRHVSDRVLSFEVPVEVTTPQGHGTALSKIAFVWIDNLQYELIQPVSGLVDIYTEALPADDSVRFHHACMRVHDWNDFRDRVRRAGHSVVLEGGSDALKFLYIDGRELVGHYLEYVWMTPQRWSAIGGR